jgi:hypothetical protein
MQLRYLHLGVFPEQCECSIHATHAPESAQYVPVGHVPVEQEAHS